MENKDNRLINLRKQLEKAKDYGERIKEWRLTPEQRDYIQELGYRVEPYLYSIKTRQFSNIYSIKSTIIKDIHYASKRGKWMEIRPLNIKERKILEENGIKYKPYKYKIYLK